MFIYLVLLAFLLATVFSPYKAKLIRDLTYWGTGCILVLLAGMRYAVGTDYNTYVSYYEHMVQTGKAQYWLDFEIGFKLLNQLLAFLHVSTSGFLIVVSGMTIFLVLHTCNKHSPDRTLSLFLYVALYFYFASYNIMRQYIALSIVFFAFGFLLDRRPIAYAITVCVAALFHSTALIMIPVFLVNRVHISKKLCLVWLAICIVMGFFGKHVIALLVLLLPKYSQYAQYQSSSAWCNLFVLLGTFALLLLQRREIKPDDTEKLLCKILMLALGFTLLVMCNALFARIGLYFYIFVILALPASIKHYTGAFKRYAKVAICIAACCVCVYFLAHNIDGVVPYRLLWLYQ